MRFSLLLALLFTSHLNAQIDGYPSSGFEECPDPLKNNIAWRKMYELNANDTATSHVDYLLEKYDTKGKLLTQTDVAYNDSKDSATITLYRYSYDKRGRIVSDSSFRTDEIRVTKFQYEDKPNTTTIYDPHWSKHIAKIIITYDKDYNIASEYHINYQGDTLIATVQTGNTTRTIYRSTQPGDSLRTGLIHTTTRLANKQIETDTFLTRDVPETLMKITTYDNFGKTISVIDYRDQHILRDSIHYTYNKQDQLTGEMRVVVPYNIQGDNSPSTISRTKYSYNADGQLQEISTWSVLRPGQDSSVKVYHIRYSYNEKGLLIEKRFVLNEGENETVLKREVFEYGEW